MEIINEKLTALYVKGALFIGEFLEDQRGVTAIEYALVAVAIASVVGIAFSTEGTSSLLGALQTAMKNLSTKLAGPVGG